MYDRLIRQPSVSKRTVETDGRWNGSPALAPVEEMVSKLSPLNSLFSLHNQLWSLQYADRAGTGAKLTI